MNTSTRTVVGSLRHRLLLLLLAYCVVTGARSEIAVACPDIDGLVDFNCDSKLEITFFGDSITYGIGDALGLGYPGRLKLLLPNIIPHNLGVPGERTPKGRTRASRQLGLFPQSDFVLVLQGVNDYWDKTITVAATKSNLLAVVDTGARMGAKALLGNLTAVRRTYQQDWVRSVNHSIRTNKFFDFYSLGETIISSDKLHPNGAGYQTMATLVMNRLREFSAANRPADNDRDGIYDFAEPRFGAVVGKVDTDNDSISDGDEVFVYHSNPVALDSDLDGFSDTEEVNVIGSDPADPRPGAPTVTSVEIL